MNKRLLLISNDRTLAPELSRHFGELNWQVDRADTIEAAVHELHEGELDPHVVIADIAFPKARTLEEIRSVQNGESAEWVALCGHIPDEFRTPLDELCFDALDRPFDQKKLDLLLDRAYRTVRTRRQLASHAEGGGRGHGLDAYTGKSLASRRVKEMLTRLIEVPLSAMIITGETGTGKGLIARLIHYNGPRRRAPLVETNCAALPKELLESELFGHEAGAFTGAKSRHRGLMEQADGGTLFLDEIADLDMDLQAKLLKAVEDQKIRRLGGEREITIDVQIIAASSLDLETAARRGHFREDLYHRLSVFSLHLPPLRERKEDLAELVPQIVDEYNRQANCKVTRIPDAVWEKLYRYDWPGNVRELRNVIERCVLFSTGDIFPARWLQLGHNGPHQHEETPQVDDGRLRVPLDGSMTLEQIDREIIERVLERCNYNVAEAARTLGATRETLRYRMRKYQLKKPA